jgi:hypothetical protein
MAQILFRSIDNSMIRKFKNFIIASMVTVSMLLWPSRAFSGPERGTLIDVRMLQGSQIVKYSDVNVRPDQPVQFWVSSSDDILCVLSYKDDLGKEWVFDHRSGKVCNMQIIPNRSQLSLSVTNLTNVEEKIVTVIQ